ncbi:MAG: twin-arginine translocase subunit TatC [Bacteroidetes bacterium]|nr:twin-arginine translocase subunit TatC [Bacteroidota bacterium]
MKQMPEKEMSFFDHIEELRWHIMRSVIAIIIFMVVAFLNKKFMFDYLIFGPTRADFPTNKFFCYLAEHLPLLDGLCMQGITYKFINTDLAGQFMLHIKTSALIGFIAAFPYIFWEFWKFIRPALYEQEINKTRGVVFFTSILFVLGCLFGYFVIAPFSINFLFSYVAVDQAENLISIENYISNVVSMVLPTGIMFELPMLVYFLTRVGILTPETMRNSRRFAFLIILFVVAIITPQGDMFSLLLVSGPILLLYELSISVSSRIHKRVVKELA